VIHDNLRSGQASEGQLSQGGQILNAILGIGGTAAASGLDVGSVVALNTGGGPAVLCLTVVIDLGAVSIFSNG
jgi:hypothetical protein